jgi:type IV pilus assembly protein PilN
MTQINLLPWREDERKIKKILFGITLGAFVCLTLVAVMFFHIYLKLIIHDSQVRVTYLQTELAATQAEITTLKDSQQKQAAIRAELQLIIELRTRSFQAVRLLNALTTTVPTTVLLQRIMRASKSVTLEGEAESDLQTTELMKKLAGTKGFNQPVLTEISGDKDNAGARHFQLKVELNN